MSSALIEIRRRDGRLFFRDPPPIPSPDRVPRGEVYEKVWAPLKLGTIELAKGRARLTVRASTKPGGQVMDLKAVRLRKLD